jgi:TPR repeat protein
MFNYTNSKEAVRLFNVAVDQHNNSYALNCLGNHYGMMKDLRTAFGYFKRSADLGHCGGLFNLASCYWLGYGDAQVDLAKAVEYATPSAEQGHPDAQCLLGWAYLEGNGTAKDEAKAIQYFRDAAEQYCANAFHALGCCYKDGQWSLGKDYDQALYYLKLAAERPRNFFSQIELAGMYKEGLGTPKDLRMALKYYKMAADGAESDDTRAHATRLHEMLLNSPENQHEIKLVCYYYFLKFSIRFWFILLLCYFIVVI